MNATATAVLEALNTVAPEFRNVSSLVDIVGKSETTVRKALKELAAEELVTVDGRTWMPAPPVAIEEPAADEPTEAPAKKKYNRHQKPTTRTVRLNQITKSEVQVLRHGELDQLPKSFDIEATEYAGEKWLTVCLTDGQAAGFDLVLDAHYASSYPTFCTVCAPKLEGKVGRRRAAFTEA
jgi:DNA-binding GntR family transcriptional regulator